MSDDRTPILIGVGQLVQRDAGPREALNPFEMLDRVAQAAADDAGGGRALLERVDTLALVNTGRNGTGNAPRLFAERLGATPRHEFVGEPGGQIGVTLANTVAERITRGETGLALIAGSHNLRTVVQARKQGVELDWPQGGAGAPQLVGKVEPGSSEDEGRYGLVLPPDIYPIFENALRAARGLDFDTHLRRVGALFSRFSEVASLNPHAWFPIYRSPEELVTVTPANRMVAFPYPKYLNAILATDQAAAFLMASVEVAKRLGVPEDRFVYWRGGADTQERAWWASERPRFFECPAMLDAATSALANARVSTDELDAIDFYSCFPVAVELAAAQLGLAEDDPRGFTVTGGLPYAGGPGSGYCLHSIATMAERLREHPGSNGLVTGNGWYLTKHAASVWSTERATGGLPTNGLVEPLPGDRMERTPAPAVAEADGPGTVETYTVLFDREGAPARGIVLGRQQDGRRFLANTPDDRSLLEAFVASEEVGRKGKLSHVRGLNRFDPN